MAYDFGTQMTTYWMLVAYVRTHGYPPTLDELCEMRHLSRKPICAHLDQLESRGYIYRTKGWRNIRLPERKIA